MGFISSVIYLVALKPGARPAMSRPGPGHEARGLQPLVAASGGLLQLGVGEGGVAQVAAQQLGAVHRAGPRRGEVLQPRPRLGLRILGLGSCLRGGADLVQPRPPVGGVGGQGPPLHARDVAQVLGVETPS